MEFISSFKDTIKCVKVEVVKRSTYVEDILFKIPIVGEPLSGTPKEVQEELDQMACEIQIEPDSPKSEAQYEKILLYMHSYLINVVLKQFPYIRGMEHSDTYQEALIALRFKAIPGFRMGKGMSFLNFAKMCIRRHLITILNASKNRQRDQSINRAVSLDSEVTTNDNQPNNTFANLIPDKAPLVDEVAEQKEALNVTKVALMNSLSDFEQMVLQEYLTSASYKEIAQNIAGRSGENYSMLPDEDKERVEKSVDNGLWRIRKKAAKLKEESGGEDLPLFLKE